MFEYLLRELFILHIAKRFRLPEFFKTFRITFLHAGRKQPSAPPMYARNPKKQCFTHQDNRKVRVRFVPWQEIPTYPLQRPLAREELLDCTQGILTEKEYVM